MSWKEIALPQIKFDLVKLQGGLDLVTPTLSLPPGVLRDSVNYEASVTGGYSRIAGYERFDGRPSPVDAAIGGLTVSALGSIVVGSVINGQTSGATGTVFAIDGLTVYYTKATGSFVIAENIRIGVAVQGTATAIGVLTTDARTAAIRQVLASNVYRADITAVPGSGPVRGVAYYQGTVYAWRNNAGGTAMVMHRSSSGGWVAVALGFELSFNTGLPAGIVAGNTVTGLTSGATGVVSRVVVQSGTFSAGTAAGRLILSSTTGVFVVGESLQVAGTTRATSGGAATAITLQPNGSVETDIGNFGGGGTAARKLYGVDGVNRGFEFDGTTYVPIVTGMAPDSPNKVKVHKEHLFYAFNASVQFSGLGTPYVWSVVIGAGELALADTCTNFEVQPGSETSGALAIYARNTTYVLYGTSSADWQLITYDNDQGALSRTAKSLNDCYALDDRGVVQLTTSQRYGNFTSATLTNNIRPFVQARRNRATASLINREKSQYRVFFNDGYGLYVTLVNGKFRGALPVYFLNPVVCADSGETPDGAETAFFGSTDGFVYKLDTGPNFDGNTISSTAYLVFNAQGNSRIRKRYRRGSLEVTGASFAELTIGYDLSYANTALVDPGQAQVYSNNFAAPSWDAFTWDAFVWDGLSLAPAEIEIQGTAENIAVRVDNNSNFTEQFTLNSLILHYTPQRGMR